MNLQCWKCALLIGATITLVGCATGHFVTLKNGELANAAQLRVDRLKCEQQAVITYPFVQVIQRQFLCDELQNCNGKGTSAAPTVIITDGNATKRGNFYASCMAASGYQDVFIERP
jgi:hypothetical protein